MAVADLVYATNQRAQDRPGGPYPEMLPAPGSQLPVRFARAQWGVNVAGRRRVLPGPPSSRRAPFTEVPHAKRNIACFMFSILKQFAWLYQTTRASDSDICEKAYRRHHHNIKGLSLIHISE